MKNLSILFILVAITGMSCSSVTNKIFNNRSPRENYEHSIKNSPEAHQWQTASVAALEQPHTVSLPFNMKGYFSPDKARSLGLKFKAKRGENISFVFNKKPGTGVIYADLFNKEGITSSPLITADTGSSFFNFDVESSGEYILRLQPELFSQGVYDLVIKSNPSLGFPVSGKKARIGSFWGAERDGGKRSHEGIDIFASRRTPVLAAADGIITKVKEGGIGGKTVWLRVAGRNLSLYYAHLDEQLVSAGQFVKKGDVLGLVGNTGNARTTPPHLHFGIYTYGGAIDPLNFVKEITTRLPGIPEKDIEGKELKLVKSQSKGKLVVKANAFAEPLGITSQGYIGELPDGSKMIIPFSAARTVDKTDPDFIAGQTANSAGE